MLTACQNDGVLPYIDWAIEQGFGVIDINVPHYNNQPEVHWLQCQDTHLHTLPLLIPPGQ